jgi:nitrate/nitrite-specific signal transduction histidine kinase
MLGIKDLKKELAETTSEMKVIGAQIGNMAEKILILSETMSESMNKMTTELSETNKSIRDSLKTTSNTIEKMSDTFSKSLESFLDKMTNMKVNMDLRDTVFKGLGIDGLIPDFLKKK